MKYKILILLYFLMMASSYSYGENTCRLVGSSDEYIDLGNKHGDLIVTRFNSFVCDCSVFYEREWNSMLYKQDQMDRQNHKQTNAQKLEQERAISREYGSSRSASKDANEFANSQRDYGSNKEREAGARSVQSTRDNREYGVQHKIDETLECQQKMNCPIFILNDERYFLAQFYSSSLRILADIPCNLKQPLNSE